MLSIIWRGGDGSVSESEGWVVSGVSVCSVVDVGNDVVDVDLKRFGKRSSIPFNSIQSFVSFHHVAHLNPSKESEGATYTAPKHP
jgi:hypothetical protein